jgi:dTDP-4-dehydrorhamnose reductase
MAMVLVFGKNGQVAKSLSAFLPDAHFFSSIEAPFTQPQKILDTLDANKPTVVINAAAYTAVDKAETERDLALQINATTPGVIANWCAKNQATLIHFSTDYVFDGTGEKPWVETDTPNPINWYGQTKYEGEKLIQASGCSSYIFRIAWVYCEWGTNFRNTIRRLACERKELKIVNDQWGSPTHAMDVARTVSKLLNASQIKETAPRPGLYHLRFAPYCTWYDFAKQIIEEARNEGLPVVVEKVLPISSEAFPTPARRPKNSRLETLSPNLLSQLRS